MRGNHRLYGDSRWIPQKGGDFQKISVQPTNKYLTKKGQLKMRRGERKRGGGGEDKRRREGEER